jgi:hypothetical protein
VRYIQIIPQRDWLPCLTARRSKLLPHEGRHISSTKSRISHQRLISRMALSEKRWVELRFQSPLCRFHILQSTNRNALLLPHPQDIVNQWRCDALFSNAAQCACVYAYVRTEWCRRCAYLYPVMLFIPIIHSSPSHPALVLSPRMVSRIASSILPSRSPSLFPPSTIKSIFAQLLIHSIMRLTHPRTKLAPTTNSRRVPAHPGLKVFCAHPAWV